MFFCFWELVNVGVNPTIIKVSLLMDFTGLWLQFQAPVFCQWKPSILYTITFSSTSSSFHFGGLPFQVMHFLHVHSKCLLAG